MVRHTHGHPPARGPSHDHEGKPLMAPYHVDLSEILEAPDPQPDLSHWHLDAYCAEVVPQDFIRFTSAPRRLK